MKMSIHIDMDVPIDLPGGVRAGQTRARACAGRSPANSPPRAQHPAPFIPHPAPLIPRIHRFMYVYLRMYIYVYRCMCTCVFKYLYIYIELPPPPRAPAFKNISEFRDSVCRSAIRYHIWCTPCRLWRHPRTCQVALHT